MNVCLLAAMLLQNSGDLQVDVRESIHLYQEQDFEGAIESFLKAIALLKPQTPVSDEEQALFDQALAKYLEHGASSANMTAQQLLEKKQNPNHFLMEFLTAAAYANLGKYDQFFIHFYAAYEHHSDHYFAYKTKAILHIKLLERAKTEEAKAIQRKEILKNVQLALNRYPYDQSLYKLLIHFSDLEEQGPIVKEVLKKIIENNIVVPRSDIAYYVRKAIDAHEKDLAKTFVEKAQSWYKYSRAIETAENILKQE